MNSVKKLKIILWEMKWTQKKLAEETGIPQAHVSYFMNGKFVFNERQRIRIANVLGVPEKEIFTDAK